MDPLYKGAIASAVSSASAQIIGLPLVDPEHFSFVSWRGTEHILLMVALVIVVAEARFWKGWADKILGDHVG